MHKFIDNINLWLESHARTNLYKLIPFLAISVTFICAAIGLAEIEVDNKTYEIYQWFYGAFGFLGGNGPLDKLNESGWLQVAAILAPIAVIATLLNLFSKRLLAWWFFVFQKKGHIIVCGLGVNNRYYIDSELEKEKPRILVIEKDKDNPFIEIYENKGIFFLFGDAANKDHLEEAGVKTCKHIVVSTGCDNVNLQISALLKEIFTSDSSSEKNSNENRALIHISQRALELYADSNLFHGEFFSYYENACRDLFLDKKKLTYGVDTVNSQDSVKLLILGFGLMGQEVAFNALKLGSFANKKKLEITIVDNDPKSYDTFLHHFPKAPDIATIEFRCMEILSPAFSQLLEDFDFTYVVTALANDDLTLELLHLLNITLSQRHFLENSNEPKPLPPIAVRFHQSHTIDIAKINPSMFQFGRPEEMSDKKNIVEQKLDTYAKALSMHYNKKDVWEQKSNFQKDTNRDAVDHYFVVKKEILDKKQIDLKTVEGDMKEMLIDVEHTRWVNFHLLHGWKHKHTESWEKRSTVKEDHQNHRLHPCLVPTDRLEEVSRQHGFNYKDNDLDIYKILDNIGGIDE